MAEEGKPKKKHTPGRGHRRKSGPWKKKRFQKTAAKKRKARLDDLRQQWAEWEAMSHEEQRLRSDKKPKLPRPKDEDKAPS